MTEERAQLSRRISLPALVFGDEASELYGFMTRVHALCPVETASYACRHFPKERLVLTQDVNS